jgi:hypothetical protein
MLRISQIKSLVLVWALGSMFATATDPELLSGQDRKLEVNRRISQVRELLHSNRQSQSSCEKSSAALDSAYTSLDAQAADALESCLYSSSCSLSYASLQSYNSYKSACSKAKGAFATYKVTISCTTLNVLLTNVPFCLVSKNTNKNCGPKLLEDDVEVVWDIDDCYEVATNTGYTDYSASKPVKKPVKRPVRRRALAMD